MSIIKSEEKLPLSEHTSNTNDTTTSTPEEVQIPLPNIPKRKSILYILHDGGGGTVHTTSDLTKNISTEFNCYIAKFGMNYCKLFKITKNITTFVHEYHYTREWQINTALDEERLESLIRILDITRPSIVHTRTFICNSTYIISFLKKNKIKVVNSFHDYHLICPNIQLVDSSMRFCGGDCSLNVENTTIQEDCSASKTWFKKVPPLKNKYKNIYCSYNQKYLTQCDAYITTSESAKKIITKNFPQINDKIIHIIEHGRDFNLNFLKNKHNNLNNRVIIFGALNAAKGIDLVTKILDNNSSQKIELHIVGNISTELIEPLQRAGAILHGKYERDNIQTIIQKINPCLTLIPSIWPETFCHTLTESWSCGIPVLASNLGATGERIQTHGGGWVLSPDNPRQWYNKIISILADQNDYNSKIDQIQDYKFKTTKEMSDEYLSLYTSIIDQNEITDPDVDVFTDEKRNSHPESIAADIETAKSYMNLKDWKNAIITLNNLLYIDNIHLCPEIYFLLSISYRKSKDLLNARLVISEGLLFFQEDSYIQSEHSFVMEQIGNKKIKGKHSDDKIKLNIGNESDGEEALPTENNEIFVIDTANLSDLDQIENKEICVIMPCIDVELGQKAAKILLKRAGVKCQIFIAIDSTRQGFIKTVNSVFKKLNCEFVVYLAQDAFPGRNWLAIAYYSLLATNKSLFAFNDGKWDGKLATFGMARTTWLNGIYSNAVFFEGYKSHSADNELSTIARANHTYVYNPNSLLLEVDYEKEAKGFGNLEDKQVFTDRCRTGFSGLADKNFVKKLALEYQVFI